MSGDLWGPCGCCGEYWEDVGIPQHFNVCPSCERHPPGEHPEKTPIAAFRRDKWCSPEHFAVLDTDIRTLEACILEWHEVTGFAEPQEVRAELDRLKRDLELLKDRNDRQGRTIGDLLSRGAAR